MLNLTKKDVRSSTRSVLLQMRSILALSEMSIRSIKKDIQGRKSVRIIRGSLMLCSILRIMALTIIAFTGKDNDYELQNRTCNGFQSYFERAS